MQVDIIKEIEQNFLESSYDTNCHRAFPDVRDGLKPSQRYCLWEMHVKKYTSDKPHVKSAKISSAVIGEYWPHNDVSMYETLVGMSQSFTNNVPEVGFHGANGNIILGAGSFASSRYTEARLSPMAEEGMLAGINKDTVPMIWNYSEDLKMPLYLPSVFPRLLVNGSAGIGVSIAQVWTLHNFSETCALIQNYLASGEIDYDNYYPDFPTGGTIINKDELGVINKTGRGKVVLRANYKVDNDTIDFYEMPYQVYIEPVIEQIKTHLEKGNITNIKSVLNKSDKKRICLSITCTSKNYVPQTLAQLFKYTDLKTQINVNQNAIVSKTPVMLNLKQTLDVYIDHNKECVRREWAFNKKKAEERLHILDGLLAALNNIDDVVALIRQTTNTAEATKQLRQRFGLSEFQAKAILDMKLSRLSHLEKDKVEKEHNDLESEVKKAEKILGSEKEQIKIFSQKLADLEKKFGTPRHTVVAQEKMVELKAKDKSNEDVVITFNPEGGYVQKFLTKEFKKSQLYSFHCKDDDLFLAFSDKGRSFRLRASEINFSGAGRGTAIGPILKLNDDEKIMLVCPNRSCKTRPYIFFAFENGKVKKCNRDSFVGNTRNLRGMKASNVESPVVNIAISNGDIVILETEAGMRIAFKADDVNETGRTSGGVIGIRLKEGDRVVSAEVLAAGDWDGKLQARGGRGQKIS